MFHSVPGVPLVKMERFAISTKLHFTSAKATRCWRRVVYIDKTKLADTQLFLADSPKNFYISGPMQYHNGAKVLVSNFKIAVFKKG